jgi:hypothetical protein
VRAIPAIALLVLAALPARAQTPLAGAGDPMAARLSAEKVGDIETGTYTAGDNVAFSLALDGDKVLLRFDGNPETFALEADRVALGGRELKYDTGATALRVSVWGGITLYTESAPGGLPATRTGDFVAPPRPVVSQNDLAAALRDESSHLAYADRVTVRFFAPSNDKDVRGDDMRAGAFDLLVNIDSGIERVVATPAGRQAFSRKIEAVKLVPGVSPGVSVSGRTLQVTFAPALGPAGRPSSHAIAVALGKFLAVQGAG